VCVWGGVRVCAVAATGLVVAELLCESGCV